MRSAHIEAWTDRAKTFLELINPDNVARADEQFEAFLDLLDQKEEEDFTSSVDLMWLLKEIIVGESAFHVGWRGTQELIAALGDIIPDPGIEIDFGVDDPEDEDFLQSISVPELLRRAYFSLLDSGYILWCWNTEGESYLGWISRSTEESNLADVAFGLGIDVRMADDPF